MNQCECPGCPARATHGWGAVVFTDRSQMFCHTHWFMLPPELRRRQEHALSKACTWLAEEERKRQVERGPDQ